MKLHHGMLKVTKTFFTSYIHKINKSIDAYNKPNKVFYGNKVSFTVTVKPKKPSMTGSLMMGLGTTLVTMAQVMMGGLALLSAKALLVSKIALVVSLILFVQYFFSNAKVST